ncbi:histidine phosphatase family protein [Hippea jasoniae]|uniref:histidine phosphatase family protein n=1 Tax=Hippea jasoniae TaxID=944479 RepID=UPI00054E3C2D|nr:histidine phosphatase family protein [Hippea jasoniae]
MEKKVSYLFRYKPIDLFIIRHPEVENYADYVFNGTIDVGLSKKGYKQAEAIKKYFYDKDIEVVYTSPLKRCRIVAEQFKDICRIVVDERLKERNFGVFESLSWQMIEKRYPKEAKAFLEDPFNYKPPEGESFKEVFERGESFLNDYFSSLKNAIVIAHGGVNRVLITKLLNIKKDAILSISQDYVCLNHFQTDGRYVLAKMINGKVCFDRGF